MFGDLGTSPLYTLSTVVSAAGGKFSVESALGVLSLIVWTLIVTVSIKYCLLVMQADNRGEGGILALMSLVGANRLDGSKVAAVLTGMGLLGAALIYGDGVITPAISVLSALEGVNVATPAFKPYIMPAAVVILVALFTAQRFGTSKIGATFGPIMVVWFLTIALLGLSGVLREPRVLLALNPWIGLNFLFHSGVAGPLILGGVFLCTTGGEALYADMGHFGRGAIRLSWYGLALPALLLSYAGQTALLIERGSVTAHPFYLLAPSWAVLPLVVLATLATIIASQAIITGSFSMTRQAMQLRWLPAVNIRQTSDKVYGQIYVPSVNGMMMVATVLVTIAFGSSDHLAGAYGTAVSTTMMLTTVLLYTAMTKTWKWSPWLAAPIALALLAVDISFFLANLAKIADGGWLPLTFGAMIFIAMTTWRQGVEAVRNSLVVAEIEPDDFMAELRAAAVPRVPGTAIFLTRTQDKIPSLMRDHVRHMGALHEHVIALTAIFEDQPRIEDACRAKVEPVVDGIWRVTLRFGFVEIPDLPQVLSQVQGLPDGVDMQGAVYFGCRDMVLADPKGSQLSNWRLPIFAFLYLNAVKVVDRFKLPCANVVEVARQIEI